MTDKPLVALNNKEDSEPIINDYTNTEPETQVEWIGDDLISIKGVSKYLNIKRIGWIAK